MFYWHFDICILRATLSSSLSLSLSLALALTLILIHSSLGESTSKKNVYAKQNNNCNNNKRNDRFDRNRRMRCWCTEKKEITPNDVYMTNISRWVENRVNAPICLHENVTPFLFGEREREQHFLKWNNVSRETNVHDYLSIYMQQITHTQSLVEVVTLCSALILFICLTLFSCCFRWHSIIMRCVFLCVFSCSIENELGF